MHDQELSIEDARSGLAAMVAQDRADDLLSPEELRFVLDQREAARKQKQREDDIFQGIAIVVLTIIAVTTFVALLVN